MAGEFFFRKVYYWPDGNRTAETSQLRLFAAWSPKTTNPRPARAAAPEALLSIAPPAGVGAPSGPVPNGGPSPPKSPAPASARSKLWIVAGGGFSMARAGCAECDGAGVFTNTKGVFFDVGGRVSPRVDVGVELMLVAGRIETEAPIRTTFILGIAQFRPLIDRGLYLRAGMGVGFAGNGIIGPIGPDLKKPYSTNALGVTYGIGWIVKQERRWTVQASFSHHVAAIGELATESGTIKNVVGNYWTSGMAIVFR